MPSWLTGRCAASPHQWAAATADTFREFGADLVVAEKNFGGSLVEANLRNADRNIPIKLVTASRGKAVRAEPIAHLYARGEVDHAALSPSSRNKRPR